MFPQPQVSPHSTRSHLWYMFFLSAGWILSLKHPLPVLTLKKVLLALQSLLSLGEMLEEQRGWEDPTRPVPAYCPCQKLCPHACHLYLIYSSVWDGNYRRLAALENHQMQLSKVRSHPTNLGVLGFSRWWVFLEQAYGKTVTGGTGTQNN